MLIYLMEKDSNEQLWLMCKQLIPSTLMVPNSQP